VGKPHRAIVMMAVLWALRAGEIFGLAWDCVTENGIYVMQRVYRGKMDEPKSEASHAHIPLPTLVRDKLEEWKAECEFSGELDFSFSSENRTPVSRDNFLNRHLSFAGALVMCRGR
jgi:integrase